MIICPQVPSFKAVRVGTFSGSAFPRNMLRNVPSLLRHSRGIFHLRATIKGTVQARVTFADGDVFEVPGTGKTLDRARKWIRVSVSYEDEDTARLGIRILGSAIKDAAGAGYTKETKPEVISDDGQL